MRISEPSLVALLGEDADPFPATSAEEVDLLEAAETCLAGFAQRDFTESMEEVGHLEEAGLREESDIPSLRDFPFRLSSGRDLGLSFPTVLQPLKRGRPIKLENFTTSLGRALKKAIRICHEMKVKGEQATIEKYKKLHAGRKDWLSLVPVIVKNRNENSLRKLFRQKEHPIAQFAKTHTGPSHTDGHSKEAKTQARPASKTWNFDFQRAFYAHTGIRKFFSPCTLR